MTAVFSVPEMSCQHCKSTIESALSLVDGVDRVEVDLEALVVTVEGGAGPDVVRMTIEGAGFDVAEVALV